MCWSSARVYALSCRVNPGNSSSEEVYMKSLMVAALVAACAFTLSAQEKKAPSEHSMTGCLQKGTAPNNYMLDNVQGNGPKTLGGVSSTGNLAPQVGPQIEVT